MMDILEAIFVIDNTVDDIGSINDPTSFPFLPANFLSFRVFLFVLSMY